MSFDPATLVYDANGLIPCIAQQEDTGEVLMMAWMNADAVARTLETGTACLRWSGKRGPPATRTAARASSPPSRARRRRS